MSKNHPSIIRVANQDLKNKKGHCDICSVNKICSVCVLRSQELNLYRCVMCAPLRGSVRPNSSRYPRIKRSAIGYYNHMVRFHNTTHAEAARIVIGLMVRNGIKGLDYLQVILERGKR